MKRILLLVSCALLCPTHVITASEKNVTRKTSRTTGTKKTARKADNKTTAKKTKQPRTQTTTAGSKAKKQTKTGKKTTKAATGSKVKTARTKTTTAGTKSKKAKTVKRAPQATKATTASRAKKATYADTGKKPAAKKQNVAKKPRAAKDQTKRVYRKGGVTYRHFNHLQNMVPQQLGVISTPVTQNVMLNKPGRGYVNANLINFTTPDGKEGQVVLDTHTITAHRAEKKGFGANMHGKQSVEVFAGSDAVGKGLALIGEYPLAGNNVQIAVDPSGHVTLNGTEKPVEFSIHQ